jgi:hypothetical protein
MPASPSQPFLSPPELEKKGVAGTLSCRAGVREEGGGWNPSRLAKLGKKTPPPEGTERGAALGGVRVGHVRKRVGSVRVWGTSVIA